MNAFLHWKIKKTVIDDLIARTTIEHGKWQGKY